MTNATRAPIVMLQRWESFCAAHRLYSEHLSQAENDAIYGMCAREHGHGHNYRIRVTLRGPLDAKTGMVLNITELKKAMRELILDDMDHRNLNVDSKLMRGINPTAENVAVVCWDALYERFGKLLDEVMIEETPNNIVTYRGERA